MKRFVGEPKKPKKQRSHVEQKTQLFLISFARKYTHDVINDAVRKGFQKL
jgi:hypothetical protein